MPASGESVREFFAQRLQFVGFKAEEHWHAADEKEFVSKFWNNSDCESAYVWFGKSQGSGDTDDEGAAAAGSGGSDLVWRFISKSACEKGSPTDNLPAEILGASVDEFAFIFKRDEFDSNGLFEAQIAFGNMRGDLVTNLLRQMNSGFVPMSRLDHGWPENVKKDFVAQMQKFMATVTEMNYQAKGMTVLYVPQDDLYDANVAQDKNVIPRLEASLIHWTRQIKEVVSTQQDSSSAGGGGQGQESESAGPLDEIEFWRARDVDLSRLHKQLQSPELQRVLEVLEVAKSSYLRHFRLLERDIQDGSKEARENLKFLSILKEPCEELITLKPAEMSKVLPNLLNIVRLIWTISTHYNTPDRISSLLRTISNEIIKRCQDNINLDKILNPGKNFGKEGFEYGALSAEGVRLKDLQDSMASLNESIECGREWKKQFQVTRDCIKKYNPAQAWDLQEGSIFAQIDAFVQRCCDLLEICEEQTQFAGFSVRTKEGSTMLNPDLPKFSGSKANEIIKSLLDIEASFLKNIAKLRNVDYNVLDVKFSTGRWHEDFNAFKNSMKDQEIMYTNVINTAFDTVSSVTQCVQVYDSFHLLAKRERIQAVLEKKSGELYTFFSTELQSVKREFERYRKKTDHLPIVCGHPNAAGVALWARGLMLRIQKHWEELEILNVYLSDEIKERSEAAHDQYKNLYAQFESFLVGVFNDWVGNELNPLEAAKPLEERLHTGLLCRVALNDTAALKAGEKSFGSLLESNFDKGMLKVFQEVYYWEKIQGSGIVIPFSAYDVYSTHKDTLRVTREHVMRVVREYNVIINSLQASERRLFAQHIRNLDRKIGPGISKYTWTAMAIKEFYVRDATRECGKAWDYVSHFKGNLSKMHQITKQSFGQAVLILIEKKQVHQADEFRRIQEDHREKIKQQFRDAHHHISEVLLNTYSYFESHPPEIQREWKNFVTKIDLKLEEALKACVKRSLQDLTRTLNGDSKSEPSPLFKVQAVLDSAKMDFKPTMNVLKDLLQTVCRDTTMTLLEVPRLWEHIAAEKAARDIKRKAELEDAGDLAAANAIVITYVAPAQKNRKANTFFDAISKDDECCIRWVKDVLKGFNACAVKLGERLNWWNSNYQPIVSQDKDTFIRRYARTDRPLSVAGQDIQRYKEVQLDVQQEEHKAVIGFIETDFNSLKEALIEHCTQWQSKSEFTTINICNIFVRFQFRLSLLFYL